MNGSIYIRPSWVLRSSWRRRMMWCLCPTVAFGLYLCLLGFGCSEVKAFEYNSIRFSKICPSLLSFTSLTFSCAWRWHADDEEVMEAWLVCVLMCVWCVFEWFCGCAGTWLLHALVLIVLGQVWDRNALCQ